jgi:hypothetical protein
MQLEELQQMWQNYDKALQQNKQMNKEILRKMITEKSGSIVSRITNWENLNIITCFVLVIVYIIAGREGFDYRLDICYFFSLALIIVSLIFGYYKARKLSAINPGDSSIVNSRKEIEKFKSILIKEKFFGLALSPLIIATIYAVVNYWVKKDNMFLHPENHILKLAIAIILLMVSIIILYRNFYLKNLNQVNAKLQELEQWNAE